MKQTESGLFVPDHVADAPPIDFAKTSFADRAEAEKHIDALDAADRERPRRITIRGFTWKVRRRRHPKVATTPQDRTALARAHAKRVRKAAAHLAQIPVIGTVADPVVPVPSSPIGSRIMTDKSHPQNLRLIPGTPGRTGRTVEQDAALSSMQTTVALPGAAPVTTSSMLRAEFGGKQLTPNGTVIDNHDVIAANTLADPVTEQYLANTAKNGRFLIVLDDEGGGTQYMICQPLEGEEPAFTSPPVSTYANELPFAVDDEHELDDHPIGTQIEVANSTSATLSTGETHTINDGDVLKAVGTQFPGTQIEIHEGGATVVLPATDTQPSRAVTGTGLFHAIAQLWHLFTDEVKALVHKL